MKERKTIFQSKPMTDNVKGITEEEKMNITLSIIKRLKDNGQIKSWKDCASTWLPVLETRYGKVPASTLKDAYKIAKNYYSNPNDFLSSERYVSIIRKKLESPYVQEVNDRISCFKIISTKNFK